MHKSIKTFTENEGNVLKRQNIILSYMTIFSAKFIRLAQASSADIADIRGFSIHIRLSYL